MDFDLGGEAEEFEGQGEHLPGGVALVGGHAAVVRGEAQESGRSGTGGDGDQVVEFQGLVDGGQGMEAVGAGRADVQAKVDFCVRAYGGGHTGSL